MDIFHAVYHFRSDKDRQALASELEDVNTKLDQVKKQKATSDKNNRSLDEQLNEVRGKVSAMEGDLADSEARNLKLQGESASLLKQLEEAEHKLGLATKQNKSLDAALQDTKGAAEAESKARIRTLIAYFIKIFTSIIYLMFSSYRNQSTDLYQLTVFCMTGTLVVNNRNKKIT